ncbi:MAG: hypothetical protein JWP47_2358 [Polaromonas sp.]|nr:hypothetical protein [Polaromonas sp.]
MTATPKIVACVDGTPSSRHVSDYANWAALRLQAPLEFLHVLQRHPERAAVSDYSGSIGLGIQENLLHELGALDEQRSKLAQQHGRALLDGCVRRSKDAGVADVASLQRHGGVVETLQDLEPEARLFVLGGQHRAGDDKHTKHQPFGHRAEQAIRSLARPVLIASTHYRQPESFVIGFDGSGTSRRVVEIVAGSSLLRGLRCHVVMVAEANGGRQDQLSWAQDCLAANGFDVQVRQVPGEPETALPAYLEGSALDLLVMGAHGHTRIRQFIVGSTTTSLLRTSPVPVLVIR